MAEMERLELERHRPQINHEVDKLVEKFRAIFDWDIPEINEEVANRLIISTIRQALDDKEKELLG